MAGHEQMDVVRHQHVGMYVAAMLDSSFPENRKVVLAIQIVTEANRPIHTTLNDVLRYAWNIQAALSRHKSNLLLQHMQARPDSPGTPSANRPRDYR
jgi:hypothetical protein